MGESGKCNDFGERFFGERFWGTVLGNGFRERFWRAVFGERFWGTILGNDFGERLWGSILGKTFRHILCTALHTASVICISRYGPPEGV